MISGPEADFSPERELFGRVKSSETRQHGHLRLPAERRPGRVRAAYPHRSESCYN